MVVGSRLARRKKRSRSDSHSDLPTTDTDTSGADQETSVDIGPDIGPATGSDIALGSDIGILGIPGLLPSSANTGIGGIGGIGGMGIGMFQPQPTPFAPFTPYGLHIANAGIPDYTFAATPLLGQFGGGHLGGNTARSAGGVSGVSGGAGGDAGLVGGRGVGVGVGVGVPGTGAGAGAGGSSRARTFAAAPNSSNFHAGASSGPAGMSPGSQGLGSSAAMPTAAMPTAAMPTAAMPTAASDDSANFGRANSASSGIHPALFDIPIPVSVPHHHQNHQHHHHHHQQPLHPNHQQHHHQHIPQQQQPHLADRTAHPYKLSQNMDLDPNETSQQEAAAMNDYEIQLEGPLVGEKVSSHAITEQYARADPTYVAKTMALPRTYSHYRPIQGDGNCGWRAIAFAYIEALVQYGSIDRIRDELQRLTGLNTYIEEVGGQDPTIFEFMVQETFELFGTIIATMSEGNDPMPHLVTAFNDSQISQCLVYHLRLLACARLKGHSSEYESWLVGSVQNYLDGTVMPINHEIDHICVALVRDILLAPANVVLEIAYLDRSQGEEVNVHRFHEGATGQGSSAAALTIFLLYRPGHYDILYRETAVSPPPAPIDVQVHRVNYPAHFEDPIAAMQNSTFVDMTALSVIPGLASSALSPYGPPSTAPPPMTGSYATSPGSHWDSQPLPPEVISAPTQSQPSPPPQQPNMMRFSKYNYRTLTEGVAENNSTYEPAFTTNTFKNSHYNTAHYNNLNFQPEMYQPDADEEASISGNSRTGGRKRSTEHCPGIKKEK